MGAYSRNEVQILNATLNQIEICMTAMEAGSHPDMSKVQIPIQDLININIEEADIDHFGRELQNWLVPALEAMSVKIQQLDMIKVRSLGSINTIISLSRTSVVPGLKGLEDWVKK